MRTVLFTTLLLLGYAVSFTEEKKKSPSPNKIPLPPLSQGGLLSLWYHDHKFIQKEYGDFELMNYKNSGFKTKQDSLTANSWKLLAIGDFLTKELSYATLARVKNKDRGLLLIFFKWHDPSIDSSRTHGIFYRTYLSSDKVLLRTKQCTTGGVDTLEIACDDLKQKSGKCYYDSSKGVMVLKMTDK